MLHCGLLSLLDSVETVIKFAQTLTFKGKQPVVRHVDKVYQTGIKLTSEAMEEVEKKIKRLPELPKWFVEIIGHPTYTLSGLKLDFDYICIL